MYTCHYSRAASPAASARKKIILTFIVVLAGLTAFGQGVTNSLFFTPTKTDRMWDTWMYFDNNTFYLYYLITKDTPGEGIGLATSSDGVNWEEKGLIFSKADSAQWIGTGSVWKSESKSVKGKYILNFSEWYGPAMLKGQQYIFFASSDNLVDWTRLDEKFVPDTSYYLIDKDLDSRWDCIYTIPRPGGGRYGYWTGNPSAFHPGFGFGETTDGVHWSALAPPVIEWGTTPKLPVIEAGAVEKINGKYYMMAGSLGRYNERVGMYTFESDSPKGPFRPAPTNFKLLTSPRDQLFTYFARFFNYNGEILVNHHAISRGDKERYFGLLKKAVVDKAGVLRLAYWPGNEKLKGASQKLGTAMPDAALPISFFPNRFDAAGGSMVEAKLPSLTGTQQTTVYIETEQNTGTAITFDSHGQAVFSDKTTAEYNPVPVDTINREIKSGVSVLKMVVKGSILEVYADSMLIQCYTLPAGATGRIGYVSKRRPVKSFTAWNIKTTTKK